MKKFLQIIASLLLCTTTTISTIACDNNKNKDFDHNIAHDITSLGSISNRYNLDDSKPYQNLDFLIKGASEITKLQPQLKDDFQIKYYSNETCTKDITNDLETQSSFWIKIITVDDSNYFGETNPINVTFNFNKTNLATKITSLDSLKNNLTVEPLLKNWQLDETIRNALEITSLTPALEYFTIAYFDKPTNGKDITNELQQPKTVWVVITAFAGISGDPNYYGQTKPLELNLGKINLKDKITALDFPDESTQINPNVDYTHLDNLVIQSVQFREVDPVLKAGYTINYYDQPNGKNITKEKQNLYHFYVQITPVNDDPIYTGKTDYIPVTIGKIQFEYFITRLFSDSFTWPVDFNKTFAGFNETVKNQLKGYHFFPDIDYDLTFQYFDDPDILMHDLSNSTQEVGTYYVFITASENDKCYQGTTKGFPITFTKAPIYNSIWNLDSIKNSIKADTHKLIENLKPLIYNSVEFRKLHSDPKEYDFEYKIDYYEDPQCKHWANDHYQSPESIYLKISANSWNKNYFGESSTMEIILQ